MRCEQLSRSCRYCVPARICMNVKCIYAIKIIIFIGLIQWKELDKKLKPTRGKRVALKVSNKAPYAEVRTQALLKWKAYQSNEYADGKEYALVFDDGKEAQFLPGSKEFFNLKRYKEETGKDYKRIVLYLCTTDDLSRSEDFEQDNDSNDEYSVPAEKKARSQIQHDEIIARQLQSQFNDTSPDDTINIVEDDELTMSTENENVSSRQSDEKSCSSGMLVENDHSSAVPKIEEAQKYQNSTDIAQELAKQVDQSEQFYIVVRRGSTLERQLAIWQCEAKKKNTRKKVMVHFAGEDGIDSGAMAKEFFTSAIDKIGKNIFPNGSPVSSMLNVHNGTFHTCGQIVAASIAQGGPPPCFLEECIYDMLVNQDVDMNALVAEKHLTSHEQAVLTAITDDPTSFQEVILEHEYTGKIDTDHVNDIVGTVMVSLVSKQLLYLNEFRKGLDLYDFASVMQTNAGLCKDLFVRGGSKVADANYVVSPA